GRGARDGGHGGGARGYPRARRVRARHRVLLRRRPRLHRGQGRAGEAQGRREGSHRARRRVRRAARALHRRGARAGDAGVRREERPHHQGALHAPAPGHHRAHRLAAALRDHGGPRQGDHAPPDAPGRRAPAPDEMTTTWRQPVRRTLEIWREIHEASIDRERKTLDYRPIVVFLLVAVSLTLQEYYGDRGYFRTLSILPQSIRTGANWELWSYVWWCGW